MSNRPDPESSGRGPLTIIYRPIGDLIPYAKNARAHDEAHVAQIAASIRAFGCLARGTPCHHGGAEPRGLRLRRPFGHHLGQDPPRHRPWRLSLAA